MALARVVSFDGVNKDRIEEMKREMREGDQPEEVPATEVIVWTAFMCVLVSIVVHGVTATPLSRALLPEPGSDLAKRRLRWTSRGGGGNEPRPEPAET